MKHLIIIGARGFGREVYGLALESQGYGTDFVIKGFLDDKSNALENFVEYPQIIGPVETYELQQDDVFICALGDVHYKKKYAEMILQKGGEFINIIHNTAHVGKNLKMGKGCIICNFASISCDVTVGDFCTLQPYSGFGHDCFIGNYVEIETGVALGGGVYIDDFVTLHPGCTVVPHKKIGRNAIVAANSVVMRNVKEGITVIGNPAKELKI